METLGSLLDKYSIAKLRHNNMIERNMPSETVTLVVKQIEGFQEEINSYLSSAIKGEIPLEEPKFKIYKGENPSGQVFENISQAINGLFDANFTLWGLEDKRRETERTDAEIRIICDDVATFNRKRNDCMDEVNKLLKKLVDNV